MTATTRTYAKARIVSFRRAKRNVREHTSLVEIEGCKTTADADFYCGKRIAYVYAGRKAIKGTKTRVIWGRVTRTHGTSGVVRAKFANNIPPKAFGAAVRVFLYPSRI